MINSIDCYKSLENDYRLETYDTVSSFLNNQFKSNNLQTNLYEAGEKVAYIVTGGIASGKSTFIFNMIQKFGLENFPYIGTDSNFSMKEIKGDVMDTYNEARKSTDILIRTYLDKGYSFIWETVLSKEKKFKCIDMLKKNGYVIICILLGTENESIEISRHKKREESVKFTVKKTFIKDRHFKNIYALRRLYKIADYLFVYDSTNCIRLLAYKIREHCPEFLEKSLLPTWINQSLESHKHYYIPLKDKEQGYWLRGMSDVPVLHRKNPVVIIHGYFSANRIGPSRLFVEMSRKLADEGYIVYRFDLSGMGESDLEFEDVTFEGHRKDVLSIIQYVYKKHNNNINIIGHCIGCNLVLSVIGDCIHQISNVILLTPFIWNDKSKYKFFDLSQLSELSNTHRTVRKGLTVNDSFLIACTPESLSKDLENVRTISNFKISIILANKDEYIPFEDSLELFNKLKRINRIDVDIINYANHNFLFGRNSMMHTVLDKLINIDEFNDHRIILVRHGESYKNIKKVQGGPGELLTPKGIRQVTAISKKIKSITVSQVVHVYSPDRMHTKNTADIISRHLNTSTELLYSMVPFNLGVLDGLSLEEMASEYPAMFDLLSKWNRKEIDIKELKIKNIDSYIDYWHRGSNILSEVSRTGDIIMVCTNSIMILLAHKMLNNDPTTTNKYRHIDIPNCGIISFTTSDFLHYTLDERSTTVNI